MSKRLTTRQRMERDVTKTFTFQKRSNHMAVWYARLLAKMLLLAEHRRLRARVRKLKGRPTDWTNGEWNAAIDAVLEAMR